MVEKEIAIDVDWGVGTHKLTFASRLVIDRVFVSAAVHALNLQHVGCFDSS